MEVTDRDVQNSIRNAIGKSLACEPEEINENSSLIDDLGMDSLDFLDVVFTLEKEFKTKIRDGSINRLLRPDKSELARMEPNLSPEEIENLASMMPAVLEASQKGPVPRSKIFSFITLDTLTKMVMDKLSSHDNG